MTETNKLVQRLCKANSKFSLREIAVACDVSHELIRKIIQSRSMTNISMNSYEKIVKGIRNVRRFD